MRKQGRLWVAAVFVAAGLLLAGCNNTTTGDTGTELPPPPPPTDTVMSVVIVEPAAGTEVPAGGEFAVSVNITSVNPLAKVEYNFCDTGWVQVYPAATSSNVSVPLAYNYPISFTVQVPADLSGTCTLVVKATDEQGNEALAQTVVTVTQETTPPPSPNLPPGIEEGVFNFTPVLPLDDQGYVKFFDDNGNPVLDGVRILAQNIDGAVYSFPYIRGKVQVIVDPTRAGYSNAVRVQLKLYRTTGDNATGAYLIGDDSEAPFVFDFDTTPQGSLGINWNEYEGEPLRLVAEIYTADGGSYVADTLVVIDNTGPDSPTITFYGVANDGYSRYVANVCGTQADWIRGTALLRITNIADVEDYPQTPYAAGLEGFLYAAVKYEDAVDILSIRDDQQRALAILQKAIEVQRLEFNASEKSYGFDSTKYADGHYAFFSISYDRLGNAKPSLTIVDLFTDNTPPVITLGKVVDTSPAPFAPDPGYLSDWINIQAAAKDEGIGFEASTAEYGDLIVKFGDFVSGIQDATEVNEWAGECAAGNYVSEVNFDFIETILYDIFEYFRVPSDVIPDLILIEDDVTGLVKGFIGYDTNGNTSEYIVNIVAAFYGLDPTDVVWRGAFPEIEDGEYYLEVTAVDALGNEAHERFGPYYVDNTDPTARIEIVEERVDTNNNGIPDYAAGSELGVNVQAYDGFSGIKYIYAAVNDYVVDEALDVEQVRANGYFASPIEIYGHIFESVDSAPSNREFEQGFRWFAIDPKGGEETNLVRLMVMAVDKAGNATLYMTNPYEILDAGTVDPEVIDFDVASRLYYPGLQLADAGGVKYNTAAYLGGGEGNPDTLALIESDIYRTGARFAKPVFATAGALINKELWDFIVEWQTDAFFDAAELDDLVADPTIYDDTIRRSARRNETIFDNNNWLYGEAWLEVDEEATSYPAFLGQEAAGTVGISPFVYMYASETQDEQLSQFATDFTADMISKIFGTGVDAVGIYFHDRAVYNMVYELTVEQ